MSPTKFLALKLSDPHRLPGITSKEMELKTNINQDPKIQDARMTESSRETGTPPKSPSMCQILSA